MFEFLLKTGSLTITGSQATSMKTDFQTSIDNGSFLLVGKESLSKKVQISVNSQSCVEDGYSVVDVVSSKFYLASGDYFLNEDLSRNGFSSFQFDENFPKEELNASTCFYDVHNSGENTIYHYESSGILNTGFTQKISGDGFSISGLEFFLNGQKLYQGMDYNIVSGKFVSSIDATGKIWGRNKQSGYITNTGINYYCSGKFIENNNKYFYCGMRQDRDLFLEGCVLIPTIDKIQLSKIDSSSLTESQEISV